LAERLDLGRRVPTALDLLWLGVAVLRTGQIQNARPTIMPEVIVQLTDTEYADLQRIADAALVEPETKAHDLLVAAINEQAEKIATQPASARSYNQGVLKARREHAITSAWNRTFERMSRRV